MLPAHEATRSPTAQLTDGPGALGPQRHWAAGPRQTPRAGRVNQVHGRRRPTRPRSGTCATGSQGTEGPVRGLAAAENFTMQKNVHDPWRKAG